MKNNLLYIGNVVLLVAGFLVVVVVAVRWIRSHRFQSKAFVVALFLSPALFFYAVRFSCVMLGTSLAWTYKQYLLKLQRAQEDSQRPPQPTKTNESD